MMQVTERPRFRTDLVAEPIEEEGHRYIDVVDPDTGNGFRFYEVEYSLACAMDGERDLAGLVQWAREDLGVEPSTQELTTVISTLGELGYLARGGIAADIGGLAAGVVAAPRGAAAAPVEDVELGFAGAHAAPHDAPLPRGDFELGDAGSVAPPATQYATEDGPALGAAGSPREMVMEFEAPTPPPAEVPYANLRPTTRPDAEDDGPTNLPNPATVADFDDDEVSVDLSDHLAISASDVKEAVRASKVMKAVDIPADLAAALDDSPEANQARLDAARQQVEEAQAARAQAERAAAERAAAEAAARPAVELPRPPVGVSRPKATSDRPVDRPAPAPTPEPAPPMAKPSSPLRLVLLLVLLAAVVGGAWYYWTQVLKKPLPWETSSTTGAGTATGAGPGTAVKPPPPPPPPPPPSAPLTELAGTPMEVVAGQAGVVASVASGEEPIAVGEELVRFRGSAAAENKLVGLNYDIDIRYAKQIADATKALEAATAAGNQRDIDRYQATITERTGRREQKAAARDKILAAMDALIVKAPVAGTVEIKIAKGARATADEVIATVTPPSTLSATFTIPRGWTGKPAAVDAPVSVTVKGKAEQKASCTVTAVAMPQVTVVCPADAGLEAGTEIVLP